MAGGTAGAGVLLHNTNSTNNSYVNLDFRAYDADARIAVQRTAANSSDMHFIMDNTNSPASMMVIKNDGKVGIGTTTVQSRLHIESGGTGNAYGSCLYLHGDTATNFPAMRIDNATGGNATETHGLLINNTAAGAALRVNDGTSTAAFIVDGTGKVGIGAETPNQTFTVASGRANFDTQNNYYGVTIDGNTSGNNAVQVGQWHNVGGRMQSGADYHLKLQTHNFAHDVLLQSGSAAGDGFVGIGTDNASAKLHVFRHSSNFFKVQNESQLRANTSGIGFEVTNTDSSGTSLRIGTSATAPSFIVKGGTSGGNVGIGTGSPDSKLEVRRDETAAESNIRGNINYSAITIQGDYTNGTYLPALSWATADNVPTAPKASIYIHQDNTGSTMILGTSNSYASGVTNNALCLDPTGQVGIGTQSPIRMLDIVASSGDPGIRLESAAQSMDVITLRNADGRVGFGGDVITVYSSKVGIGEINPGYPLEVVGATGNTVAKFGQNMALHMIHNAPVLGFNLYYNSGYKFGEGSSSSYGGYIALSTGTGTFKIATSNAGNAGGAATMTERVTILNDGKVGIGETSPGSLLTIKDTGDISTATFISGITGDDLK